MTIAIATEYTENYPSNFQLRNMFIELTETGSLGRDRPIYVNVMKIQSLFGDSVGNTVIALRRETIKVTEDYETVKSLISISEKNQSNTKRSNSR